ncbi:uncharacterized protein F5891DRAFT_1188739 [Suillus fuscotomentosus]|uniref:Uncharacterized protein n=1 Tax=Suillus fuscotomentosus TaxID=1912939 RepID=A0AAD4HL17_9AGAM|nr:uncharacterized protein F5891DRAFT_1188739 [Suillus fuscotomentosus]KAG1900417.1 hypothetical protein F5891DRAFT_1188739 [Suillus fuscotomentosus]
MGVAESMGVADIDDAEAITTARKNTEEKRMELLGKHSAFICQQTATQGLLANWCNRLYGVCPPHNGSSSRACECRFAQFSSNLLYGKAPEQARTYPISTKVSRGPAQVWDHRWVWWKEDSLFTEDLDWMVECLAFIATTQNGV